MSYKNLKLNITEQVGLITINREEKRNAMDVESWLELDQAIQEMNENNQVRAIIITGQGEK